MSNIIELINPDDKGLPRDLLFSAMSNTTLAKELERFLMRHTDKWKLGGDEQGLLKEVAERLIAYS